MNAEAANAAPRARRCKSRRWRCGPCGDRVGGSAEYWSTSPRPPCNGVAAPDVKVLCQIGYCGRVTRTDGPAPGTPAPRRKRATRSQIPDWGWQGLVSLSQKKSPAKGRRGQGGPGTPKMASARPRPVLVARGGRMVRFSAIPAGPVPWCHRTPSTAGIISWPHGLIGKPVPAPDQLSGAGLFRDMR